MTERRSERNVVVVKHRSVGKTEGSLVRGSSLFPSPIPWEELIASPYREQAERIMEEFSGDVAPECLGAMNQYRALAEIIPRDRVRTCGTCKWFQGAGKHCACPDWFTSRRAIRWAEDGQWCREHSPASSLSNTEGEKRK